tara:strand:- start:93 stop:554 length:462 start_codon:yes stop_codon:yes gene_type:complete
MSKVSEKQPLLSSPVVDHKKKMKLQVLNTAGFVIAMFANGFAQELSPKTLNEISTFYDSKVQPSGYAFGIWGIIYFLLLIFTVYQALPSSPKLGRNDDLIFNKIGYVFFTNMILNSLWLVVFMRDEFWSYLLALGIIVWLLITSLQIMFISGT